MGKKNWTSYLATYCQVWWLLGVYVFNCVCHSFLGLGWVKGYIYIYMYVFIYLFILFFVIPNVFPSNSQGIPIKFSKCSPNPQCVPQDVPNSTTFLFHMFSPKLNLRIFQTTINPLYNHTLGDHFFLWH
jgi:hypothetical protein